MQAAPPTTWYRFVAGLNAQLRLVRKGRLRSMFRPILIWLETFGNPALKMYGLHVDLARFEATTGASCQYGLLVYALDGQDEQISLESQDGTPRSDQQTWYIVLLSVHPFPYGSIFPLYVVIFLFFLLPFTIIYTQDSCNFQQFIISLLTCILSLLQC